VVACSRRGE